MSGSDGMTNEATRPLRQPLLLGARASGSWQLDHMLGYSAEATIMSLEWGTVNLKPQVLNPKP